MPVTRLSHFPRIHKSAQRRSAQRRSAQRRSAQRRSAQRGTALVEFVLCFSLFWIPIFFGTAVFGFDLIRGIQVTQLCREAGHMYAFGTDFSQSGGQTLLSNLAIGMNLGASGNAKAILSTVTYIDSADCKAGGLQPNSNHCPNYQQYVFTRRVAVPSSGGIAFNSRFGSPNSNILDSSGGISQSNQLNDLSARVSINFPNTTGITLVSGQVSYVSETYATALNPLSWTQYSNPATYAVSYF